MENTWRRFLKLSTGLCQSSQLACHCHLHCITGGFTRQKILCILAPDAQTCIWLHWWYPGEILQNCCTHGTYKFSPILLHTLVQSIQLAAIDLSVTELNEKSWQWDTQNRILNGSSPIWVMDDFRLGWHNLCCQRCVINSISLFKSILFTVTTI